jgi:hypothetical protein
MTSFQQDYQFGIDGENFVLPLIEAVWGKVRKLPTNHKMDYVSQEQSKFYVEVKRRTNKKSQYPTTVIPYHKIRFCEEEAGCKVYFLFIFTDGFEFVEYNKGVFDTFFIEEGFCRRWKRSMDKPTKHIHIPIEHLKPFEVILASPSLPETLCSKDSVI